LNPSGKYAQYDVICLIDSLLTSEFSKSAITLKSLLNYDNGFVLCFKSVSTIVKFLTVSVDSSNSLCLYKIYEVLDKSLFCWIISYYIL